MKLKYRGVRSEKEIQPTLGLSQILDLSNKRLRVLLEDFQLDMNSSSPGDQCPIKGVSQHVAKLVTQKHREKVESERIVERHLGESGKFWTQRPSIRGTSKLKDN